MWLSYVFSAGVNHSPHSIGKKTKKTRKTFNQAIKLRWTHLSKIEIKIQVMSHRPNVN